MKNNNKANLQAANKIKTIQVNGGFNKTLKQSKSFSPKVNKPIKPNNNMIVYSTNNTSQITNTVNKAINSQSQLNNTQQPSSLLNETLILLGVKTKEVDDLKNELNQYKEKLLLSSSNISNTTNIEKMLFFDNKIFNNFRSLLDLLISIIDSFNQIGIKQKDSGKIKKSYFKDISIQNLNISNSVDIFESYINEEDKRQSLVEQIQSLLIIKLNSSIKDFNDKIEFLQTLSTNTEVKFYSFDHEINKIKSWSSNMQQSPQDNSNIFKGSIITTKKSVNMDIYDDESIELSHVFSNLSPRFQDANNFYVGNESSFRTRMLSNNTSSFSLSKQQIPNISLTPKYGKNSMSSRQNKITFGINSSLAKKDNSPKERHKYKSNSYNSTHNTVKITNQENFAFNKKEENENMLSTNILFDMEKGNEISFYDK